MNELSYRERIIRLEYDSTPLKEHKNLGGRDEFVFAAGHVQGIMQAAEVAKEADARIKELEKVCRTLLTHYSCSLDWQPGYVRLAREAMKNDES